MVRETFKKKIKKTLLELKDDLLQDISQGVKSEKESSEKEIGDIYDIANNERDRELSLILNDREREKLLEIEDALDRIEEDSYGVCDECGESIAEGRLKILPFAKVCVDCKSKTERMGGSKRTYNEYQDILPNVDVSGLKEGE